MYAAVKNIPSDLPAPVHKTQTVSNGGTCVECGDNKLLQML